MEEHPGMEKLEQLQEGRLRGAELLKMLRHLENCDQCFRSLPPQQPRDFIEKILKRDIDDDDDESPIAND